jgi:sialidase-1
MFHANLTDYPLVSPLLRNVGVTGPIDAHRAHDSQWHHVALRRSGDTLSLIVDGATLAGASAAAGSLTYGDTFAVDGFQLGAKPDGSDPLKGSLDEFRIFRRSLTDAELDDVRLNNTDLGTVTSVRLPFEVVTDTGYARMQPDNRSHR